MTSGATSSGQGRGHRFERLRWLGKRISRISPQEVPYRILMLARAMLQSRGLLGAHKSPQIAGDARYGRSWCAVPRGHGPSWRALDEAARAALEGRLGFFGTQFAFDGGVPDWNADPVTRGRIEGDFGPFIDFRNLGADVDVKYLWEINRHLWWVALAQRYALTGDAACLQHLGRLIRDWVSGCPYPRGANWASPVEHGIRLINWSLVWHLIGGRNAPLFDGPAGTELRLAWERCIYQHVRFASDYYSRFSSANNHLVGEAAGVFVALHTWDLWTRTRALRSEAKRMLEREALRQFSTDGVNLEQSLGYQRFCLQFLFAAGLAGRANGDDFSAAYWSRVECAATFLASMMDCRGATPNIGDSDDSDVWCFNASEAYEGNKFLVGLAATLFQRGDLRAKLDDIGAKVDDQVAWLTPELPPRATPGGAARLPSHFPAGGYAILGTSLHRSNEFRAVFDCGPLGLNRIAGHGHADALSLLVSWCGEPLLVDSGTYCYNTAPELREFFRGTGAHNTMTVDGVSQAIYGGGFLWLSDVNCRVVAAAEDGRSIHAMHDGYTRLPDPVVHHRRVTLDENGLGLRVEDWIEANHQHQAEIHWHAASGATITDHAGAWLIRGKSRSLRIEVDGGSAMVVPGGAADTPQGWVSTNFYQRSAAPVLRVQCTLSPRQVVVTRISCVETTGRDA